jgi:hypothetical protein
MPGRAPRRYKMDENGTVRSAFHGKLPEEFTEQDMLAFAADTDLLLFQKVSEETLAVIHAAGYDYQGGAVIPRPGKETNNGGIAVFLFLFQLSEPSKKARPPGRIIPAINMK